MTRLELAASGVTGRRSNQLSYTRMVRGAVFSSRSQGAQAISHRYFRILKMVLLAVETRDGLGAYKFISSPVLPVFSPLDD